VYNIAENWEELRSFVEVLLKAVIMSDKFNFVFSWYLPFTTYPLQTTPHLGNLPEKHTLKRKTWIT
jgi:hypothetical protein